MVHSSTAGESSIFSEGGEGPGSGIIRGEQAMARCAASLVSKIASVVRSLCGFVFQMSYFFSPGVLLVRRGRSLNKFSPSNSGRSTLRRIAVVLLGLACSRVGCEGEASS